MTSHPFPSPPTITHSFVTNNVICSAAYGVVASSPAQCSTFDNDLADLTFTGDAYYSGATLSNDGGTGTLTGAGFGTGQAALSYFYNHNNAPMTGNWDFTTIWQDNSGIGALPTLR